LLELVARVGGAATTDCTKYFVFLRKFISNLFFQLFNYKARMIDALIAVSKAATRA